MNKINNFTGETDYHKRMKFRHKRFFLPVLCEINSINRVYSLYFVKNRLPCNRLSFSEYIFYIYLCKVDANAFLQKLFG
tara:strand:+ start:94 stop:330 length:237 start_codon:yes stop_codon:yes gene_type:complete